MKLFLFCLLALAPLAASAANEGRLVLPDFAALTAKASDSVVITLDAPLLKMAARFLDSKDADDAATQDIIRGLQGIYVRSYSFDADLQFSNADIEPIRRQLTAPGWNRLVQTRSHKSRADVDIYLMTDHDRAIGLALIASEPRQLTIVNIVGAIDLDKLEKLQGQFGVPKLDLDLDPAPKPAARP